MSIQAKREERKAAAQKVQALVNDFPKDQTWGEEQDKQYNELIQTVENLDEEIVRMETVLDLDAKTEIKNRAAAQNISTDEAEHQIHQSKAAFAAWARGGVAALNEEQRKLLNQRVNSPMNTMSTGTGSEGGYLTETETARSIAQAMKDYSGMRQLATVIQTATGNQIDWPTADATAEEGEIVGENSQASDEDTTFGIVSHVPYKYSSKGIAVPFELLQDSVIDIEAYIRELIAQRLGRITEKHFTIGTGTGQPHGIITTATAGKVGASGQTATVTHDDLVDLEHSVDPAYRLSGKCGFMFHDTTLRDIKKLKDADGRPLYLPGLDVKDPATINGYRYAINQNMPVMAASAKSIAFGDFSKYIIRDIMQIMMFRMTDSAYTKKGQVGFLAFMRSGGRSVDVGGAIKYYQNAAS